MSKVYFTDLRTTPKRNLFNKIEDLLNRTKIDTKIMENDLVAVKLHFGEYGNTAYLQAGLFENRRGKSEEAPGENRFSRTQTLSIRAPGAIR